MTIDTVKKVFKEVFEDEHLKITPETTAQDVEGWDSFNHINLILALEEVFSIAFSTEEIAEMAKVDDLITILQKRGIDVSW